MMAYFRLAELSLFGSLFGHRESLLLLSALCLLLWACRKVHAWKEVL